MPGTRYQWQLLFAPCNVPKNDNYFRSAFWFGEHSSDVNPLPNTQTHGGHTNSRSFNSNADAAANICCPLGGSTRRTRREMGISVDFDRCWNSNSGRTFLGVVVYAKKTTNAAAGITIYPVIKSAFRLGFYLRIDTESLCHMEQHSFRALRALRSWLRQKVVAVL